MSFTFDYFSQSYRSQLYVNGWMMGKRVSNLGLQYQFPVYQGRQACAPPRALPVSNSWHALNSMKAATYQASEAKIAGTMHGKWYELSFLRDQMVISFLQWPMSRVVILPHNIPPVSPSPSAPFPGPVNPHGPPMSHPGYLGLPPPFVA
ncbi:hypothetical protein EDD22DRAFT_954558 [Suillus occidentalis]|nr:hypothetical protein EDD22DRAFT_954558 [Suillus occidentalis]